MTPEDLLRQLAEHHEQHLDWLRRRLGSAVAPEDVEDFLQGAYGRALAALREPTGGPSFADMRRAEAWLRTIAYNLALDSSRQRRGRPRDSGELRPHPTSLDADELPPLADERVHVEDEVVESLERDARRQVIADAIDGLDARHRQILQLRYGRDLDPQAIMVLEGLNRRQWEGRHTRAVKAFGRELARLQISSECARTRRLLRRRPAELLGHGRAPASEHVATCVACGAFARSAQFALAVPPLPSAIAAWRYEAAERLDRARRPDVGNSSGGHAESLLPDLGRTVGLKLSAAVAAGAVGISALLACDRLHGAAADADADPRASRRLAPDRELALAAHETRAQALARSAREMARERAQSTRGIDGPDARPALRPARTGRDGLRVADELRETADGGGPARKRP